MTSRMAWFSRSQASEYLAEKLPFKTEKQWYSFLANNRTSKEVYKLRFQLRNNKVAYNQLTLDAFIRVSSTHTKQ